MLLFLIWLFFSSTCSHYIHVADMFISSQLVLVDAIFHPFMSIAYQIQLVLVLLWTICWHICCVCPCFVVFHSWIAAVDSFFSFFLLPFFGIEKHKQQHSTICCLDGWLQLAHILNRIDNLCFLPGTNLCFAINGKKRIISLFIFSCKWSYISFKNL